MSVADEERMKAFCHCQPSAGGVPADAFGFAVTFAVRQAAATRADERSRGRRCSRFWALASVAGVVVVVICSRIYTGEEIRVVVVEESRRRSGGVRGKKGSDKTEERET